MRGFGAGLWHPNNIRLSKSGLSFVHILRTATESKYAGQVLMLALREFARQTIGNGSSP